MIFSSLDHTISPDIFTASPEYDKRFSGEVGQYFLEVQWNTIKLCLEKLAGNVGPLTILEIGGGHLQITKQLLDLGHKITVHGSSYEGLTKLRSSSLSSKVEQVICDLSTLSEIQTQYDIVIALRLIPHVVHEGPLLGEFYRLAKVGVIFDFASTNGLNALSKITYGLKRKIEKNTRPYFNHSPTKMKELLGRLSFQDPMLKGEFVAPMGIHRLLSSAKASKFIEATLRPLRDLWGNPIICSAKK